MNWPYGRDHSSNTSCGLPLDRGRAVSPVAAGSMMTTLVLFVLVYGVVGSIGLYFINRLIARGPEAPEIEPAITGAPTLTPQAGALAGIKPSSTPMSE